MSFEGEEDNARACYTNTEKSGEEDTDVYLVRDNYQNVEMNVIMPQISEYWEHQDFQPSGNSGEKQDNLAAKQAIACSSENVPWKLRDYERWQYATSELDRNYNVNVPHMNMTGESKNQEENMINYNIPILSYAGGLEIRGGNTFNSYAVTPQYVGGAEMRDRCMVKYVAPYNPSYTTRPETREGIIFNSNVQVPFYAEGPDKRAETIFHPQAVDPRYVGGPEMKGGNIYNSQAVQPRYVGGPERRGGNIYSPQEVEPFYFGGPEERNKIMVIPNVIPAPSYLVPVKPEIRDENLINYYVPVPVNPEGPEKREESMVYPNVLMPSYSGGLQKRERNIFIPQAVERVPLYARGQENRIHDLDERFAASIRIQDGGIVNPVVPERPSDVVEPANLFSPHIAEPLYAGGPEMRGGNIYNPRAVQPRYAGDLEKRGGNIYNPQAVQPRYVEGPERRGGNIYNPQAVEPFYPRELEERNRIMAIPNVIPAPSYLVPVKPEIRDENLINYYVPVPVNPEGPEKRKESMAYPNVLMPSYSGGLEKRERNIFIPQAVERVPLYARGQENRIHDLDEQFAASIRMRDGGIVNPVVPERPSDVVEPANLFSRHIAEPLYAGGPEMLGGSMVNPCNVINHCELNSINKYEYRDTSRTWHLNFNKENNLIKEAFINKQKDLQYINMQEVRKKLPVWSQKDSILEAIHNNQVVIVSGEAGCGKSTQIPQFVLDDWIINGTQNGDKLHINIICTQPRKINAVALAERIAAERTEIVGDVVGYHVNLEKKSSSRTRLTFCTTWMLLQRLMEDFSMAHITHVIVDEVQERTVESDFILMILKDLLPKRPSLKIILMSATLSDDKLSLYFKHAPVLSIPRTSFPVEQIFLEDALEKTGYSIDKNSAYICAHKKNKEKNLSDLYTKIGGSSTDDCVGTKDKDLTMKQLINRYPNYSEQTYKNLYLMNYDKINYNLIVRILVWIITGEHDYPKEGSILIFLPDWHKIIYTLRGQLESNSRLRDKITIVPLHSDLSNEERSRVFQKTKGDVRKIVISTNLAETSITIDDCVFVIDSGRINQSRFIPKSNMECFVTGWVSQVNVMQRKDRAGRVMPGVCIHLYTSHTYKYFAAHPEPEILRVSLESLLLHIAQRRKKVYPNMITQGMLDSPDRTRIMGAIKHLQTVDVFSSERELTSLGHHLSKLPVNIRIGKLILYGAIFCCLDSALTIAAYMSYRSPFKIAVNSKIKFFNNNSDHLTILRAYTKWQKVTYRKGNFAGSTFARKNFLSINTLCKLVNLKYQFLEHLLSIGFVCINLPERQPKVDKILIITGNELNRNNSNDKLLQGLICAALSPNIVKLKEDQSNILGPQHPIFEKESGEFVKIHPSSVISDCETGDFSSPFLAGTYQQEHGSVFILEVSMIPFSAVILFSGLPDFQFPVPPGNCIISHHNWFKSTVDAEVGHHLCLMRRNLEGLLTQKMRNPRLDLTKDPESQKIIDSIVYAVDNYADKLVLD